MFFIKYFLIPLWRIWFYVLLTLAIVLLFPLLIVSILKKEWYPFFFKLARLWAAIVLFGMGFVPKVKSEYTPLKGKSYIFIANHTSMADIMLMLYVVKNPFVFIGKKELGKLPLFGYFYKRTCILVDRNNSQSKRDVFESANTRIKQGLGICVFPEGGVPDDETIILDNFKDGAFRLAIEHQIPVLPLTFHDNKKRFSYTFFSGSPGKMRVKIHKPLYPTNYPPEKKRIFKEEASSIIRAELLNPTI